MPKMVCSSCGTLKSYNVNSRPERCTCGGAMLNGQRKVECCGARFVLQSTASCPKCKRLLATVAGEALRA